jgi:hypothetical protein
MVEKRLFLAFDFMGGINDGAVSLVEQGGWKRCAAATLYASDPGFGDTNRFDTQGGSIPRCPFRAWPAGGNDTLCFTQRQESLHATVEEAYYGCGEEP